MAYSSITLEGALSQPGVAPEALRAHDGTRATLLTHRESLNDAL